MKNGKYFLTLRVQQEQLSSCASITSPLLTEVEIKAIAYRPNKPGMNSVMPIKTEKNIDYPYIAKPFSVNVA